MLFDWSVCYRRAVANPTQFHAGRATDFGSPLGRTAPLHGEMSCLSAVLHRPSSMESTLAPDLMVWTRPW